MNGTYKDVIVWAKNRSPTIKQTLAATIKKTRPIIARFLSFKKRNEFLFSKSKVKTSERFPNIYLTEGLTHLRYKLLNYVKTKCGYKFVMCHTYNGKIKMKECGKEEEYWDYCGVTRKLKQIEHCH